VLLADAVGGDQDVDGLADGSSGMPQPAIVVCRFRGERDVNEIDDLELEELRLDRCRFAVIAEPLQYFGEDDRRQTDPFVIQAQIEPLGFRVGYAIQEIDPDRRIDDDQASEAPPRNCECLMAASPR
jgi:hypothetical protein